MPSNTNNQNNRSTFSILFYLNRSKAKKSGKCPIMGRISVDGKSTAFSTGLDVLPQGWDAGRGLATGKSAEETSINKQIKSYKAELARHYKTLLETRGYLTAESLKNALRGSSLKENTNTLTGEFAALVEEKKLAVGILVTPSTYVKYAVAYRHLKDFLRDKDGKPDIPLGQVDFAFIEAYAYYLKIDLQMAPRTVNTNMKPLKTTIKRALNKGFIRQDPFFDYRPEKITVKRRWLSMDEIERLMRVQMKRATANFVRDMFLFSTFTGIAYADLKNLRQDAIQKQADGSLWIVLNRQKTGTASCIPLLDIPVRILEKYKNTAFAGENGIVFKLRTLENTDIQLKKIAQAAGIDKRLTFHMSRHTFASLITLSEGVPIETVSRMLGHKNIKTTQIYAEVSHDKILRDMKILSGRIAGKYTWID
ncbi:Tyrosine recombinase XerC [termite gut metagenome]|uniref:Tyrosine recombinase XerC n=1 Tax=termite gut metagenome TaxID=433724 RepID=A0A5J4RZ14_9ZZZZ